MSTLVTRSGKGSPLTHNEVDANFTNLNTDKVEKTSADITGGTINNTTVGATTPSTGVFTTLTGNSTSQFGRSSANYLQAVGAASSSSPIFSVAGSDTNIDLNLTTKGTGAVNLNTGGGTQVQVSNTASAVNYVELTGGPLNNAPTIGAKGSNTNISFAYSSKGTGGHDFYTSGASFAKQLVVANTTSAVNFVQVTGAATGGRVTISSQGSDTNVPMIIGTKGSGSLNVRTDGSATTQFAVTNTSSAVNYINVTGGVASSAPTISALGTDTNIDLTLTPKGTGNVRFGTYTASILTPTGYVEIKDSGGTVRRLLVG